MLSIPTVTNSHKNTKLNYLRLLYAQFLTSLSTAVFIFLSIWLFTSTNNLWPSKVIVNQLHGQLVSTWNYRAKSFHSAQDKNCINNWVTVWFCTFYYKACIAGTEPTAGPWSLVEHRHIFSLDATGSHYSAPHMNLKLLCSTYMWLSERKPA